MRNRLPAVLVAFLALVTACAQSDKELCEDARKKLLECRSNDFTCPDDLHDSVREQYECIVDADDCSEIGDCAE